MNTPRRMIVLTDGYNDWHAAKTAVCVIRYRPEQVVAVLDREGAGKTCQEVLGLGGEIPVVGSVADAAGANALLMGIAPPGGKIPKAWRPVILEAIRAELNVISGLHDFLNDDPEFVAAAAEHGVELIDVRKSDEHDVASREGIREGCLRIQTIANDCSCGKMVAAVEVAEGLKRAGVDAKFVATGQTGVLVEGDGCAVDRVICDFLNGTAEKLVRVNQHHEVIVIEGQGSLFHPRYSNVTLGLLHGSMPDGLIACYEMGRTMIGGMEPLELPSLERLIEHYEASASVMHPSRVIGVSINSYKYSDEEAAAEREKVRRETGLPVCDVIRDGPDELVEAVLDLKRELKK
ncbi:MAG: DUF1611 domain-containing protein [Planctomycetes bacterium]|nr:DUF1611 domain-containing protein [Planctomycetota bacterium]